jgi:hypothetical protein
MGPYTTGSTFGNITITVADLVLTGGPQMSIGSHTATIRTKLNYIPEEISNPSSPAFYLQTYPATAVDPSVDDASRQNIAGPSWAALTAGVWVDHVLQFSVGTFPFTRNGGADPIDPTWVGTLYSLYGSSTPPVAGWYHNDSTASGFPILVSKVDLGGPTSLKIVNHTARVHFH